MDRTSLLVQELAIWFSQTPNRLPNIDWIKGRPDRLRFAALIWAHQTAAKIAQRGNLFRRN
jgi:hypothetical protein